MTGSKYKMAGTRRPMVSSLLEENITDTHRNRGCFNCGEQNYGIAEYRAADRLRCWRCGIWGHKERFCDWNQTSQWEAQVSGVPRILAHLYRSNLLCNYFKFVLWNGNSWTTFNTEPRKRILNHLKADVIYTSIIETKLKGNDCLSLSIYTWHGFNHMHQCKTTKCGAWGIGIFINDSLTDVSDF